MNHPDSTENSPMTRPAITLSGVLNILGVFRPPGADRQLPLPASKLIDQRNIHRILHRYKGKYFWQPVWILHKKQKDRRQKYRHQIDQRSGYLQIDAGQCWKVIVICLFDHIKDRCRKYHRRRGIIHQNYHFPFQQTCRCRIRPFGEFKLRKRIIPLPLKQHSARLC